MAELEKTIWVGIASFVATNLDDIFLLTLFFSQRRAGFRAWQIVLGQLLGFSALVAISLLGFVLQGIVSHRWLGLLGVFPILIGLLRLRRQQTPSSSEISRMGSASNPVTVAAVTFASGADNIGVYTPLFATMETEEIRVVLLVFAIMLGLWCGLGALLGRLPWLQSSLDRYGHMIMPFVLIALGVYVLIENLSYELLKGLP